MDSRPSACFPAMAGPQTHFRENNPMHSRNGPWAGGRVTARKVLRLRAKSLRSSFFGATQSRARNPSGHRACLAMDSQVRNCAP